MTRFPTDHLLGRMEPVSLNDTPVLSRDVAFDLDVIRQAWPVFEHSFDSLRGRKMMGLIFDDEDIYRMCSVKLDRDVDIPLHLYETVVPGGSYLRMRMVGAPPVIYTQIPKAFEVLFENADHDESRPHIEYYRREGEVDCLVPIHPTS